MRTGAVVVAVLAAVLAGCEATPTPSVASLVASSPPAIALTTATPTDTPSPTPRPTPRPTAKPTPLATPPAPVAVKIKRQGCFTGPSPDGVLTGQCVTTVKWNAPLTKGTEIRVYGITECLPAGMDDGTLVAGSCLIRHQALWPQILKLIAKAPASNGRVSWTGPAWQDNVQTNEPQFRAYGVDRHDDDIYFAIVLAAYNAAGHSKFIIADAGTWCYKAGCVGP